MTGQVRVFENELLNIEELDLVLEFKMHPILTSKTIYFKTNLEITNANIYNLEGRKIYSLKSNKIKKLDVSNLASGAYIIQLSNEHYSINKRLLIK
ncbi:T9SS type A sorting domain-containing protein [Lacinutrix himadriensis]|uniref:T9SS type A sorting domain-containing protein n=1 Tax=Lacinutrix himadriensis TaxID=641549 RepID=UPI0006E2CAF0|nr:T9SS type A sorting domain-containing protein [Lacinutrix himadriensis]